MRWARSSLPEPPQDLRGFPSRILTPVRRLWRIHRADREPWWFCSDRECRFDLAPPAGTCYVAEDPLGSFVEVFQEVTVIAEEDVAARRLSELRVPQRMRLADCTSPRARGFGCTGEIHTTADYELTQKWASCLAEHGFDGIRHLVRHDRAQRRAGIALLGQAGAADAWPEPATGPIGEDLVARAARDFGIHVLPRP